MNDTISVIIPVYNVEKYLRQSLESVLNQDYSDIEVILIDDGSSDSSGKICDEYADQDSRVMVIHQENHGAAAAKNAGLRVATGRYLSFVDSDDFLEAGAYSHMLNLMKTYGVQVVQCAFRDIYVDHARDRIIKKGRKTLNREQYISLYVSDWTCALLWDKLYERSLFDNIFFKEGRKIDDEFFTYKGILNAETILCDDRIVYNYRKRSSGVMASRQSAEQIVIDRIDFLTERRKIIKQELPDLKHLFDRHFIESMLLLSKNRNLTARSLERIKKEIKSYYREKKHTRMPLKLTLKVFEIFSLKKEDKPVSKQKETKNTQYFD